MKKVYIALLLINLVILNLAVSYLVYGKFIDREQGKIVAEQVQLREFVSGKEEMAFQDECSDECGDYVDEKVSGLESMISQLSKNVSTDAVVAAPATVTKKTKTVTYLPISGSGSTLSTSWIDIPGTDFYMSKSDYPGLVGIYFEANMKLINGNGEAYLRLYDVTHGIAVSGSEISTSSQTSTFVTSGSLNFWSGYNNYRVQARSLTADTTVFESGKLKIIAEN